MTSAFCQLLCLPCILRSRLSLFNWGRGSIAGHYCHVSMILDSGDNFKAVSANLIGHIPIRILLSDQCYWMVSSARTESVSASSLLSPSLEEHWDALSRGWQIMVHGPNSTCLPHVIKDLLNICSFVHASSYDCFCVCATTVEMRSSDRDCVAHTKSEVLPIWPFEFSHPGSKVCLK